MVPHSASKMELNETKEKEAIYPARTSKSLRSICTVLAALGLGLTVRSLDSDGIYASVTLKTNRRILYSFVTKSKNLSQQQTTELVILIFVDGNNMKGYFGVIYSDT